jgi:hypothetical protein
MTAVLAAALLAPGAIDVSVTAGTTETVRVARGTGPVELEASLQFANAGALRPLAGARATLLDAGPVELGVRGLAGRTFPIGRGMHLAATWDAQLGLRADATFGRVCLVGETAALLQTTLRAENSALYGVHLAGADVHAAGPLWLTGRGGVRQSAVDAKAIGWAGVFARW